MQKQHFFYLISLDLSIAVPITNSLTMLITTLAGQALGEGRINAGIYSSAEVITYANHGWDGVGARSMGDLHKLYIIVCAINHFCKGSYFWNRFLWTRCRELRGKCRLQTVSHLSYDFWDTVDQEHVRGVSSDWRSHEDQGEKRPSGVKKNVFLSLSQSLLLFKGDRHSLVENDKLFWRKKSRILLQT